MAGLGSVHQPGCSDRLAGPAAACGLGPRSWRCAMRPGRPLASRQMRTVWLQPQPGVVAEDLDDR